MAPIVSKVKILFVQATPPDQQALDTGIEQSRLDDALWASLNRDVFDLRTRAATHIDDLVPGLRRFRPQVVHFSGHGEQHGDVVFSTPDGKASHLLSAENFAETLRLYTKDADPAVSLVVLAGCYTDEAAQRLSQFVGCAVGMADRVGDTAMVETFTPTLYRALGDGRNVTEAVTEASQALLNHGYDREAQALHLWMRTGVDAGALVLTQLVEPVTEISAVHLEYLRGLFGKPWAQVRLADMLADRDDEIEPIGCLCTASRGFRTRREDRGTSDHGLVGETGEKRKGYESGQ